MQALPSGHNISELPPSFPCAQCHATIEDHKYAVRSDDNEMICYPCAHAEEISQALGTGHLFAYPKWDTPPSRPTRTTLTTLRGRPQAYHFTRPRIAAITNFPGQPLNDSPVFVTGIWRSNFGDTRTSFQTTIAGVPFYGIACYGNGDYCRLTRNKNQEGVK